MYFLLWKASVILIRHCGIVLNWNDGLAHFIAFLSSMCSVRCLLKYLVRMGWVNTTFMWATFKGRAPWLELNKDFAQHGNIWMKMKNEAPSTNGLHIWSRNALETHDKNIQIKQVKREAWITKYGRSSAPQYQPPALTSLLTSRFSLPCAVLLQFSKRSYSIPPPDKYCRAVRNTLYCPYLWVAPKYLWPTFMLSMWTLSRWLDSLDD